MTSSRRKTTPSADAAALTRRLTAVADALRPAGVSGASRSSFEGMVVLIFGSFVADRARGDSGGGQTNDAYAAVEDAAAALGMELMDARGLFDLEYVDTWPAGRVNQALVDESRARGLTQAERDELLSRCAVAIVSAPFPLVCNALQRRRLLDAHYPHRFSV
jgi:hypothetical protein